MQVEKMRNSRVVPEHEYVSRKNIDRKHSRKQRREDKRSFDYSEDKQDFGKSSTGAGRR